MGIGRGGRGYWMKMVKWYKLTIVRQISTGNIMYNKITTINTAIKYI